ncbi:hypothetical protein SLEP1_g17164 [Rubroshorea leprosula]|uniref:Disease resistance RPP13-like protein 1 n=1 Tax=Rubroshorea leprosula TaxID=152421 RepID=A0AAV5J516_9ROSI|nr:hypothetical protein SLEP1_g17164 [Rubroshorea leprosula]
MEAVSFVGGSLLSAAFDLLSEKLNGYLRDQLRDSKEEIRAQMESWNSLLPKITAVLQHAEENQVANQFVKSCLDDLRDLAYDMEDILEEFVIDAKRSELIAESEARPGKRQRIISSIKNFFSFNKAKPNQEINSMVKVLSGRLQKIDNGMRSLDLTNLALKFEDKSHKVVAKRLPESSLLEDKVWGRDKDKDAILQRLLEDGGSLEQGFVIPIVGMGGLGKTTLARLIYNDKKLEGRFDLMAWVCVSDEFDVARITRTILEQVTRKKCVFDDFGLLQEELKGKLSGCKFFLVLDDVWNKEYGQWDVLKRPFMSGAIGSKIIVTTRNKDVGTMMRGDDDVHNLELLQDDACLPLFTRHALGKENFDAHPDLRDVGEKLVKKCKRLPLALKTLGGVLRGKLHCDEWENILNSEIWSSSEDRNGILPALRLSYCHLPSHLKRCFAYCALFPKDYEFDQRELVLLWMTEGLLQQQSNGKKQMEEEIGHQYFQELLSRSLFQQSSKDESQFVMHDLINDLAVDVAGEIYCNLERSMGDGKLEKARHLSFTPHFYEISERFTILDKLKHLRTVLPLRALSYCTFFYLSKKILHDFLPTLNRVRVLSLHRYNISQLPDCFENLKHIRYIDLSCTLIKSLPDSVGSLLFLQTLLLCGCYKLTKLPMTIGNLVDLYYLDINDTPSLKEMPSGIGNLKKLLTMSKFIVGKESWLMRLSYLKNLSQLRGRLFILDLQNVLDVQEAREANLHKIHGLEELVLEWTASDNDRDELFLEMQVLSCLKPHSNLKSLEISCYGGKNFPPWVCDPSLFFNLSTMELNNCKRCTLLPSLGQLPVLKKLVIKGMEEIETVGLEFYGQHDSFRLLEELVFQDMLNWKEWISLAGSGSEGEFPCLRRLVIYNCCKLLGQLPHNLSSLKELDVRSCNAMLLKSMGDLSSLANLRIEEISGLTCLRMSMNLPSLKELCIENCNGVLLKSMVDLTFLTKLRIQEIAELTCLPKSFTQSLTALETLEIGYCNDLTCLWEEGTEIEQSYLPFNLKHLSLKQCRALKSLPNAMMVQMDESNSSNTSMLMLKLEKLEIYGCDSLKSFPRGNLPITLKYLRIEYCKGLESLPDADGNSEINLLLKINNLPSLYSSQGSCHQLPAYLRKFKVRDCEWLELFPERMLQHCTGLQTIDIYNCKLLKSLPTLDCVSSLVELSISRCEVLESLPEELWLCTPNLKELAILWCYNFRFLPNTMYQLKSLQRLCMEDCPSIEFIPDGGLPLNLIELALVDCRNLKFMPSTLYQLTSLQRLTIPGGALMMGFGWGLQNLVSLQQSIIEQRLPVDIVLPSSLTSLEIWNEENLKAIPGELFQNLNSLQELFIIDCPKLQSLPRKAFPPSLGLLCINRCPHLKRQHFEAKGDYWTLTCTIPCIEIDEFEVNLRS